MPSIETIKRGNQTKYRIRLTEAEHEERPRISFGNVSKQQAEQIRVHIAHLHAARISGSALKPSTAEWLGGLPDKTHQRLSELGLVQARNQKESFTVSEWCTHYLEMRTDIKSGTAFLLTGVASFLDEFAGNTKLTDFNQGMADGCRRKMMEQGLAEATIRRKCKRMKQFFAAAVKHRYIQENPFEEVPTGNVSNPSRWVFVERETMDAIIRECPDLEWKLLFALSRYGGLRIPSEIHQLQWSDLDWEKRRFLVRSPKTEHFEGKDSRVVPLFPELIKPFQDLLESREQKEGAVFPELSHLTSLRYWAVKYIRQAGFTPWLKVFQNLRSSRETELAEDFPLHVVTSWLGNTPEVAKKSYLQTHEGHFERAVVPEKKGWTEGGPNIAESRRNEAKSEEVVFAAEAQNPQELWDKREKEAGCMENSITPSGSCIILCP